MSDPTKYEAWKILRDDIRCLSEKQKTEIICDIVDILWGGEDDAGPFLDFDKEWDADTGPDIANRLADEGIVHFDVQEED